MKQWTDTTVENIIGILLRVGVVLSALVVVIGATVYLRKYAFSPAEYRVFLSEPEELRKISGIWHEALQLHGRGLIQFGLLLLIATPVARVIFSMIGFAAEKDRMYVGFTLIVLVVLLHSLFGPH
jgi:uncharacterized membrane protein